MSTEELRLFIINSKPIENLKGDAHVELTWFHLKSANAY